MRMQLQYAMRSKTSQNMGIYGFPSLHFEQKPHCTAAWSQNNSAKNDGYTLRAYAKKTANMLS